MRALLTACVLALRTNASWNMVGHDSQQSSLSANSVMAGNGISVLDLHLSSTLTHQKPQSKNGNVAVPPVVDDDTGTFFIAINQSVYALSTTTAAPQWTSPYVVSGVFWTGISRCVSSIILAGDDGSVHSLDFASGKLQWKVALGAPLTPPICDQSQIYFGAGTQAIALTLASGGIAWNFPLGALSHNLALGLPSQNVVYIAIDNALVCLTTSGGKVYTVPRSGVSAGLVVSMDGSVLLVAAGYSVFVYSAQSGARTCEFATNYLISGSPTLGPNSVIYIASMDNSVYAVSTSCSMLWNVTVYGAASPSLDGNGGLYLSGTSIHNLNASTGQILWTTDLLPVSDESFSTLALDVSGTAYVGSTQGHVMTVGLSLPVVLSQYQTAIAAALTNNTALALNLLSPICALSDSVNQLPSTTANQKLVSAVTTVCQTQNNLANGLDPYGHPRNYVNAVPFTSYQNLLTLQLPILQNLEMIEQNFSSSAGNIQQQLALAQQAHQLLQVTEQQWTDTITKDQGLLKGYSASLSQVRQQMEIDFNATGPLFDQLQAYLEQQIADLKAAISSLQADEARMKSDAAHEAAEGMLLGMIPFIGGALRADKLAKAAADLKQAAQDAIAIQKDKAAIDEMMADMTLIGQMQNYTIALEQLNSQIDQGNQTLPELLPEIFMDEVDQARLSIVLAALTKSLSQFPGGAQLVNTIEDYVALSQSNVDGVLAWYSIATKIQHAQGALDLLKLRDDLVQINMLSEMSQLVAVEQAKHLVDEHRKQQSFLSLQTINNELSQFSFWALRTYPNPLPMDPSSQQLMSFMQDFQAAVIEYQNELDTNATEQMWVQYQYNSSQDAFAFDYFWATGKIALEVPLPFTANGTLGTNFFNVRMRDVRVVLLPASSCTGSDVNPSFMHDGSSLMVDSSGSIFNFTHDSNWNYGFRYDPSTLCPNTQACTGPDSPDCPSGVNFSPYGRWYIDVSYSPGIPDRRKITSIALQFQVTYQQGGPQSTPFFGRSEMSSQYPIPKSEFCSK